MRTLPQACSGEWCSRPGAPELAVTVVISILIMTGIIMIVILISIITIHITIIMTMNFFDYP